MTFIVESNSWQDFQLCHRFLNVLKYLAWGGDTLVDYLEYDWSLSHFTQELEVLKKLSWSQRLCLAPSLAQPSLTWPLPLRPSSGLLWNPSILVSWVLNLLRTMNVYMCAQSVGFTSFDSVKDTRWEKLVLRYYLSCFDGGPQCKEMSDKSTLLKLCT